MSEKKEKVENIENEDLKEYRNQFRECYTG